MSGDWKPGDVALWRPGGDGAPEVIYFCHSGPDFDVPMWVTATDGEGYPDDAELTPLVVIDPEDRERLAEVLRQATYGSVHPGAAGASAYRTWAEMADIFLDLLQSPPKPEEPTGIGAVVEAIFDNQFVHIGDGRWQRVGSRCEDVCSFADIAAVNVLSPGVTP